MHIEAAPLYNVHEIQNAKVNRQHVFATQPARGTLVLSHSMLKLAPRASRSDLFVAGGRDAQDDVVRVGVGK